MVIKVDNVTVNSLAPSFRGKPLLIAIDSSKTNTALVIEELDTGKETVVEIRGADEKDVKFLCKKTRDSLASLFQGSNIIYVGIEDIITKKNDGLTSTHEVRFKLTYIFSSLCILFEDKFNIGVNPINNQAWKTATIGKELNKRDIYKGSVEYISKTRPQYRGYTDDVTDALCIKEFIKQQNDFSEYKEKSSIAEHAVYEYKAVLMSYDTPGLNKKCVKVGYNYSQTIELNANHISNNARKGQYSYCKVDLDKISLDDLIKYTDKKRTYLKKEPYLYLVIYNKDGLE